MFCSAAKTVAYWFADPVEAKNDPIMMVAHSLASIDTEAEDFHPWHMDKSIAIGLIWGITDAKKLTHMQTCLKDFHEVRQYMQSGFDLIFKLNSWDIENGFIELANAFDNVPELTKNCHNTEEDWAELYKWYRVFWHPYQLVTGVWTNVKSQAPELMHDAVSAKAHLAAKEYYDFGYTLGQMFILVTSVPETMFFD